MIDGEGHVDDDGHLRPNAGGADSRAAAAIADLLLRRCHGDHLRGAGLFGITPECLEHNERADSVVDRSRYESAVRKLHGARVDNTGVANRNRFFRLVLLLEAEVNPEIREFGRFLTLFQLDEMHRLFADDAENVAVAPAESQPLSNQYLRIPAA